METHELRESLQCKLADARERLASCPDFEREAAQSGLNIAIRNWRKFVVDVEKAPICHVITCTEYGYGSDGSGNPACPRHGS
jgi:hypothetical protein